MFKVRFDALGLESKNKMAKMKIPNLSTGFFTFRMAKRLGDPKARRLPKVDLKTPIIFATSCATSGFFLNENIRIHLENFFVKMTQDDLYTCHLGFTLGEDRRCQVTKIGSVKTCHKSIQCLRKAKD